MAMQLKMSSISSSGWCYFYPRNQDITARSSSLAARRRFQPDWEVVKGMDCLPNPKTPWVKLPSGIDPETGLVIDSFYSLLDNQEVRLNRKDCLGVPDTAKCFAATGEWLAFVDSNDDCPIYLTNPFFNCNDPKMGGVIRLPSMATIPSCAGVERDPQTGHVIEFNMFATAAEDVEGELSTGVCDFYEPEVMVRRVKNISISHLDPHHADCVAVAIQGAGPSLAYSRIWDDTALGWIGLQEDYDPRCGSNQLAFSHAYKMFYTIDEQGIEVFDLFSDRKKRSRRVLLFPDFALEHSMELVFDEEKNKKLKYLRIKTYLAELEKLRYIRGKHLVVLNDNGKSSDLLLIVRHLQWGADFSKTLHFDVFKVDFFSKTLKPVKNLGDQCVFVGADQSFALRASKFPGLQPNSIYFIDKYYDIELGSRRDRGIFNMANNKIEPLQQPISDAGEELFWVFHSSMRNT